MTENKNPILDTNTTCPAIGYQTASICVPVNVKPFANAGYTKTKCCGKPVVIPGTKVCAGIKNGECSFTITQDICVEVPVEFGATALVGDTYVECDSASTDEQTCESCKEKAKAKSKE